MSTVEEKIQQVCADRKPEEIAYLNLSNFKFSSLEGLTSHLEKFTNLEKLNLANVGLENLKGFPVFKKLKRLDLSDNQVTEGLEALLECEELVSLSVAGNEGISEISAFTPLANLKSLSKLDVYNTKFSESSGSDSAAYRMQLFDALPQLLYIDGMDRNNEEAPEDDDDSDDDENDDEVGLGVLAGEELEDDDEEENYQPDSEEEEDEDEGLDSTGATDDGPDDSTAGETAGVVDGPETTGRRAVKRKLVEPTDVPAADGNGHTDHETNGCNGASDEVSSAKVCKSDGEEVAVGGDGAVEES